MISEITGIAVPKPKKVKAKEMPTKASKAIDEILYHLDAFEDEPKQELIEVHQIGKPSKSVAIDKAYKTKYVVIDDGSSYKTKYFDNDKEAQEYAELVSCRKEMDDRRRIHNQKYRLDPRYYS